MGDWIQAFARHRQGYAVADGISDAGGCAAAGGGRGQGRRVAIGVVRRACLFSALGIAATVAVGAAQVSVRPPTVAERDGGNSGTPRGQFMTVRMIVADTDSVHTRIRDTSAGHGGPPEHLPRDSVIARRKAAAHARRFGADSIQAHSATPEGRAVP